MKVPSTLCRKKPGCFRKWLAWYKEKATSAENITALKSFFPLLEKAGKLFSLITAFQNLKDTVDQMSKKQVVGVSLE